MPELTINYPHVEIKKGFDSYAVKSYTVHVKSPDGHDIAKVTGGSVQKTLGVEMLEHGVCVEMYATRTCDLEAFQRDMDALQSVVADVTAWADALLEWEKSLAA